MKKLRGNVRKHLPLFQQYIKQHGPEVVRGVLKSGHFGKARLKLPLNRKDRSQLIEELGL